MSDTGTGTDADAQAARRDRWVKLVGTMLTAATDPRTPPGEAEAMMAKAMQIMAQYEIDETLARAVHGGTADDPIVRDDYIFHLAYARAFAAKLGVLAEILGCHAVMSNMRNGDYQVHLFGRRSVIDRLKFLYPSLTAQCANQMLARARELDRNGDRAFKRSFIYGFCEQVLIRMRELMERQRQTLDPAQSGQYALVLVSDLEQAATLRDKAFPKTAPVVISSSSRIGFRLGDAAGQRADLGQTRVGTGRLAIGS